MVSEQPVVHSYDRLTPDRVLDAIESTGDYITDGHLLALNSYENRVYQIGIDGGTFLVAKFYRANRWSDEAIADEHHFAAELAAAEIPVVAPLEDQHGATLLHHDGFRFALYPRHGGRWPELHDPQTLLQLGRFLGRLHGIGASSDFHHRITLSVEGYGERSRDYLLEGDQLSPEYRGQYADLSREIIDKVQETFDRVGPFPLLRLHGDCHPGNILWRESGPNIVDLDDCCMGPMMQDLWMLLSGDRPQMQNQLIDLVEGYEEFADFHPIQLHLIESLRSLRLLHYAAWLARRWDDPAFPRAFPWFGTVRYWEDQVLTLREQLLRLDDPPLRI